MRGLVVCWLSREPAALRGSALVDRGGRCDVDDDDDDVWLADELPLDVDAVDAVDADDAADAEAAVDAVTVVEVPARAFSAVVLGAVDGLPLLAARPLALSS